jgi:UDP-N-acetylglucosamine 4,6-dehydratase/5-epimerase
MLNDKTILITGGTGSFGNQFAERIFNEFNPNKIIIYSRDEYKQYLMQKKFEKYLDKLRFFIGDIRDKNRLYRAFDGVDVVIHAAALKQVPVCEYNPIEAIRTNVDGAANIIDAAIDRGVKKVVALSTDKAVNPVNLYGATKLVSDKLFVSANAYVGDKTTTFSVVRYGNVASSRGSIIPYFMQLIEQGQYKLPVTDVRMTRFWISLNEGVDLVFRAIEEAKGGEIYVSKIPSFKITDLVKAVSEKVEIEVVGIREGEKLHEVMITEEDSRRTYEYDDNYIIYPHVNWWKKEDRLKTGGKLVREGFTYSSENNASWLSVEEMRKWLSEHEIGL